MTDYESFWIFQEHMNQALNMQEIGFRALEYALGIKRCSVLL